jgi:hypothetical protein
MKIVLTIAGVAAALIAFGWLGFQITPAPFASHPEPSPALDTIPLPDDLPAPVARFYRKLYGEQIPVITSVVITGRAQVAPFGFMMPARYRFIHEAGRSYRHYIETTFYGVPLMKVHEGYLDGTSYAEVPIAGKSGGDPQTNQAANLGLWAESQWFPALFLTDPRVRWEPIDDHSALLIVPFEDGEDQFVVRFDPETDLILLTESMRYRTGGPEAHKILWVNSVEAWGELDGQFMMTTGSATWLDQGKPWAYFTIEEIVFNVDVSDYVRATGP